MYKWVQEPGVVERSMKKGEGAQQMSTSFHIKVHIKCAFTIGCYQLQNLLGNVVLKVLRGLPFTVYLLR